MKDARPVSFKLQPDEREMINAAAYYSGDDESTFIRMAAVSAALKEAQRVSALPDGDLNRLGRLGILAEAVLETSPPSLSLSNGTESMLITATAALLEQKDGVYGYQR